MFDVPEMSPDVLLDGIAAGHPLDERRGQRALRRQADRPVDRHPAHHSGVQ
jgi:hypothetical protein